MEKAAMSHTSDASNIYHETAGAPGASVESSAVQVAHRMVSAADLSRDLPKQGTTADAATPLPLTACTIGGAR